MRITDTYGRYNNPAVNTSRQGATVGNTPKAEDGAGAATPTPSGEKVTLSAQAQELAERATNDADTAKVEKLRSAIQNGTFKVDHAAIAQRIVDGG